MNDERRVDPEPITIYLAILATVSASIAAANYARTHLKPAPSKVRGEILAALTALEDETRYLLADLGVLKDIFEKAKYPSGRTIQLRNGAYLTGQDFERYERLVDSMYRRLRVLNRIGLDLEKAVAKYGEVESGPSTNLLGEAYRRLEELLYSRNLSVERAWNQLEELTVLILRAVSSIREQLQPPPSDA
jgi:hypothetical protein